MSEMVKDQIVAAVRKRSRLNRVTISMCGHYYIVVNIFTKDGKINGSDCSVHYIFFTNGEHHILAIVCASFENRDVGKRECQSIQRKQYRPLLGTKFYN